MYISATARRLMNIGVLKRVQPEERGRALVCNRAGPSGDASSDAPGDAPGDSMRPGPMSAEAARAESCASFKENARCNCDPCIPAGGPAREMYYDALDNIRTGKCDSAALCAMQIEVEGDIVQLPKLGDLDTLAAFVQTSFVPFMHEFEANSMSDSVSTGYDTHSALSGFSESGNGFDTHVQKSLVKKRTVCSLCGGQGHNKRSCFNIMTLR